MCDVHSNLNPSITKAQGTGTVSVALLHDILDNSGCCGMGFTCSITHQSGVNNQAHFTFDTYKQIFIDTNSALGGTGSYQVSCSNPLYNSGTPLTGTFNLLITVDCNSKLSSTTVPNKQFDVPAASVSLSTALIATGYVSTSDPVNCPLTLSLIDGVSSAAYSGSVVNFASPNVQVNKN